MVALWISMTPMPQISSTKLSKIQSKSRYETYLDISFVETLLATSFLTTSNNAERSPRRFFTASNRIASWRERRCKQRLYELIHSRRRGRQHEPFLRQVEHEASGSERIFLAVGIRSTPQPADIHRPVLRLLHH